MSKKILEIEVPSTFPRPILAVGGRLKGSFALAWGDRVRFGYYRKGEEDLETLRRFKAAIARREKSEEFQPRIIARDLHPGYLSSGYAASRVRAQPGSRAVAIQHHHAHIVSCLADNGISNRAVIGIALDGSGLGTDGNIWGGEFLLADAASFKRVAHLDYLPLPGGEKAIREPWRMGAVYLRRAYGKNFLKLGIPFTRGLDRVKWNVLEKMMERKVNSPLTSSMGRLFDAVSAILGFKGAIEYEGQAALELERALPARSPEPNPPEVYPYTLRREGREWIIMTEEIIRGVVEDLKSNLSAGEIALKFHQTIARLIVGVCREIGRKTGKKEAALSGGVFQNKFLLSAATRGLEKAGFAVYSHRQVPPHDGGLPLGQAIIAGERL